MPAGGDDRSAVGGGLPGVGVPAPEPGKETAHSQVPVLEEPERKMP